MLTASGANYGFRRTVPYMAGIMIGFAVMVMAVGLELAQVFTAYPGYSKSSNMPALLIWFIWFIGWERLPSPQKSK